MAGSVQKVYWVTGASSGIGREVALQLAQQQHRVYVSARSAVGLVELARLAPEYLIPLPCDVSDRVQLESLFDGMTSPPQWLDGIILCAGSCEYIELESFDITSFDRVMASNFYGVVNACQVALPLLRAAYIRNPERKPEIIGLCSMSCYVGFPRAEAYGASKAAMRYFLESLRCDVQHEIAVTVVYPGFVATPMTQVNDFPMPFMISASEAAHHVVRNMGKMRRSVSFPWQLHILLKIASILPSLWYGRIVSGMRRNKRVEA